MPVEQTITAHTTNDGVTFHAHDGEEGNLGFFLLRSTAEHVLGIYKEIRKGQVLRNKRAVGNV